MVPGMGHQYIHITVSKVSPNVQAQLILCNIQTTACDYASLKNAVVVIIIQCGADEYYTQISAPLSSTTLQHEKDMHISVVT